MSDEQSIRDELISALDSPQHAPMSTHSGYDGSCQDCPWQLSQLPPEDMADALLAHPVIRRIQAEAWAEGAEYAWGKTGEGWNGEYADGHGTHDGTVSFIDANGDHNPYLKRGETA